MKKNIILLIILLSIFMIGAVSASNNTDNSVLGSSDNGCSVVEKINSNGDKFKDKNPIIRKKHTNSLVNKDIIKSFDKHENKLLSNDEINIKAKRIGTKYKNTCIIARFTYSNGSAFANSKVKIEAIESSSGEVEYGYPSQEKILKTNEKGQINYNLPLKPTTWYLDFYAWNKDNNDWKYITTKTNFKIDYLDSKIIAPSKISTYYKSGKKITIRVVDKNNKPTKNVKVTFSIGDKEKTTLKTNSKGYVYFKTNDLKVGNHEAKFSLPYEPIYNAYNEYTTLKIKKVPLKFEIHSYIIKSQGKKVGGAIEFRARNKYTNKLLELPFKLKIYTGNNYKTIKLSTKKTNKKETNYVTGLGTNGFSKGNHKVIISVISKYYTGSIKTKLKIPAYSKKLKTYYLLLTGGKEKLKYKL